MSLLQKGGNPIYFVHIMIDTKLIFRFSSLIRLVPHSLKLMLDGPLDVNRKLFNIMLYT